MVHLKEVKRTAIKQNMHQKMSINMTPKKIKNKKNEIMQISTYIIKAKQHIHQDMPQNTCSGVYKCISIKM